MAKRFNVTGDCKPDLHYMVDITERLQAIEKMIAQGDYLTINRPRQYGKTTTLRQLITFLKKEYLVIYMDFQKISRAKFRDEHTFAYTFGKQLAKYLTWENNSGGGMEEEALCAFQNELLEQEEGFELPELFESLSNLCDRVKRPVVLLVDEVDAASNYDVFLDFLAQLRAAYLNRDKEPTFQSVILAGVYDVKNLKRKFVKQGEHQTNSPWNISVNYLLDMSFSQKAIAAMLQEYEEDYQTEMDITAISEEIYALTQGYPVLVSAICRFLDEQLVGRDGFLDRSSAWTRQGVGVAVKQILNEKLMLFESLKDKMDAFPDLRSFLYRMLMQGEPIPNNPYDTAMEVAKMFGFVKAQEGTVVVANRMFEAVLYEMFLNSAEMQRSEMYRCGGREKTEFIKGNTLDMPLILSHFVDTFHKIYGNHPEEFLEAEGRRFFLLYLRPIINGLGNYYIESQTRDQKRTDVIVDYAGKQYVIEMKIWHGTSYNRRGEQQLLEYLDYFGTDEGYLLSFNFNKEKRTGIQKLHIGGKTIVEAVV